jgi:hypothetical protein
VPSSAPQLSDSRGGFISAPVATNSSGVFKDPPRTVQENSEVARFANLLNHYTADQRYRQHALHAMRYISSMAAPDELRADVLLADRELGEAPIHITVVGGRDDAATQSLHAAARGRIRLHRQQLLNTCVRRSERQS